MLMCGSSTRTIEILRISFSIVQIIVRQSYGYFNEHNEKFPKNSIEHNKSLMLNWGNMKIARLPEGKIVSILKEL